MKGIFSIFTILIFNLSASCQDLKGIVIDQQTMLPISYVSIGIINKPGGCYADNFGKFQFNLSSFGINDSLRLSCIGYKPITYSLNTLIKSYDKKELKVYMNQEIISLKEVSIIQHKYKKRDFGNKFSNRHICISASEEVESGIIVKNAQKIFLNKVSLKLSSNCTPSPDSVLMRINIYNLKNDLPYDLVNTKPIYFLWSKKMDNDKIAIDIEKYGIIVKDDFAATIEIIKKYGNGSLSYAGWISGVPTIYKYGKQGKWSNPKAIESSSRKIYQSMIISVKIEE